MQARHEPSSTVAPGSLKYSILPDLIAVRQVPQFPARQPESIITPFDSAKSNKEDELPSHTAVVPDRVNVTFMLLPAVWCALGLLTLLTVAGPNAS